MKKDKLIEKLKRKIEKRLEGYVGLPLEKVVFGSIFAELLEELEDGIEGRDNDF